MICPTCKIECMLVCPCCYESVTSSWHQSEDAKDFKKNYDVEIEYCNIKINKFERLEELLEELFPNRKMYLDDIHDFHTIISNNKKTLENRKKAFLSIIEENPPLNKG